MTTLLPQDEIVRLCCGIIQPARQLAFLRDQRGFVRAYMHRGLVCLEREHYEAVCRGQYGSQAAQPAPERRRIASLQRTAA